MIRHRLHFVVSTAFRFFSLSNPNKISTNMLDVADGCKSTEAHPGLVRLSGLTGFDNRVNDVLYYHPQEHSVEQPVHMVVYFGGDVQDFLENMNSSDENKNYLKWSLDNVATLLHESFPNSYIMVVRPSRCTSPKLATFMDYVMADINPDRIEFKTFSCFDNFVPSSGSAGAPEHTPLHNALQHLDLLIQTLTDRLKSCCDEQNDEFKEKSSQYLCKECPDLSSLDLKLIGFSKGCVVLNQFLYEFHFLKTLTPDDDSMMQFVSRIKEMYWLDGGHSGGKNTWITSRSLLETLSRLGINIQVHVTPYQIQDERRPWIRKEEQGFTETLKRLGVNVNRQLHFSHHSPNLYTHFQILNAVFVPANLE